ncbi:MAG: decarboxylating 6-phosphogluconate dehydrogenase [Bacteroidetes bacterium]|nr:MAG: decarboxylating 6-phosphogluconate dehydrogenase [Bacteroidota bacterium]
MQSPLTDIGIVGLGKMGLALACNMRDHGFRPLGWDLDADARQQARTAGIALADSLSALPMALPAPRVIWMMVPAGKPVDDAIEALLPALEPGDVLIDGGNSRYTDTLRRAQRLEDRGIHYLDCGTSGGVEGARHGACTMVGGPEEAWAVCRPLFEAISVPGGTLYCGPSGSGHYVKMVHNGIEYGMMQAIAEGFELMHEGPYTLDLAAIARLWNHGSVIRSWLIELTARALEPDAELGALRDVVRASGEGQWTVEEALRQGVPTPVIALSLMMRQRSQQQESYAGKLLAALRNQFGGHSVVKKEEP